ncbi:MULTISPECIES: DUF5682 family protein [unclassified Streptomyces]|uniref:DUF5682 family protein n=1 Tax=unclassified Streptomyces TaxID=2593676 RepID=UPI000DAEA6FB|nr:MULTISPECIES: DUF5682 family protein [unclassified Streptomyces]PZT77749.1 hypothetical protein DNK56_31930 [Streptomyces sp. AC1-42W]PZT78299.1 hypothetical protein DNK55_00760 [Streptomyces sp. AC1-42T]
MTAVFLGVRHHSPACARLVERTVERLRPAHVLVEGPAEMNARLDELLLGHELPVAVFSHYRDGRRAATSWAPLCDYSPEWVALRAGRAAGAEVRFIDLPAWHPAFAERGNRYADAEVRYAEAAERLCRRFAVDSPDALWDRLFEVGPDEDVAERLDAYFALVRGDAEADAGDRAREAYMASWVRAAVASAGGRPVLVVTGGFHQPALRRLAAAGGPAGEGDAECGADGWPLVPRPPAGADAGSFLVPYSFRRLDAFTGYESGMPSPGFYQDVWERGPQEAADRLLRAVVERLRARKVPVSTADLVAARSLTEGLTALRGHPRTARIDVLDGLAGALITDDLDGPLPWTVRGALREGTHPVVVEILAACGGGRVGRLHPDTPAPPLVHDVAARLERLGLSGAPRTVELDLTDARDLERSRALHGLRVLGVPGHERTAGPVHGVDPVFTERWEPRSAAGRDAALVEAGAHGATLEEAAAASLAERVRREEEAGALAAVLFDAVLCGVSGLSARLLADLGARVRVLVHAGPLGSVLATALGLWRHDRIYGVARGPLLAAVISGSTDRLLWLLEGVRGAGGVDLPRLRAVVAVRDAVLHAPDLLATGRDVVAAVARRIGRDAAAPLDVRGAAFGLHQVLAEGPAEADAPEKAVRAVALSGADALGDWLAGLFAVARDELTSGGDADGPGRGGASLVGVLDEVLCELSEEAFLAGLPALRQAFAFFPPRERERIAARLLARRGLRGSSRALLRTTADPLLIARAGALENRVTGLLTRYGLGGTPS